MSVLLQLNGIGRSYPQGKEMVPVLHDVSLTIREGEYTAIMGPSGSGKSTLMNIIGCLDRPTTGSYLLDGVDVLAAKEKDMAGIRLKKIGFVFQQYFLMASETACENVELPLVYAGVKKKQRHAMALEMLKKVGLEDRAGYRPDQLSGGQCQRVAIARAIANHPKLLLADEPTGALDSKSGLQIMDLFSELHQEGMTILMITHDANIAAHADRILHIFDGRLSENAPEETEASRREAAFERAEADAEMAAEIIAQIPAETAVEAAADTCGKAAGENAGQPADTGRSPEKAGNPDRALSDAGEKEEKSGIQGDDER